MREKEENEDIERMERKSNFECCGGLLRVAGMLLTGFSFRRFDKGVLERGFSTH